jgi:hypothetical protein
VLCKTESHRFKECPLLNDGTLFLLGFAIRMCTTMSKELRSAKHRLANPSNPSEAQIHQIEEQINAILNESPAADCGTSSDFPPGKI